VFCPRRGVRYADAEPAREPAPPGRPPPAAGGDDPPYGGEMAIGAGLLTFIAGI